MIQAHYPMSGRMSMRCSLSFHTKMTMMNALECLLQFSIQPYPAAFSHRFVDADCAETARTNGIQFLYPGAKRYHPNRKALPLGHCGIVAVAVVVWSVLVPTIECMY